MRCCVCECQIRIVWWSVSISDMMVQFGTAHAYDLIACSSDCIETVQRTVAKAHGLRTLQVVVRQYLNNQYRDDQQYVQLIEDPFE